MGTSGPLVVLVGPPGAGKTTVGEALAARLGVSHRDTDADIVAAAGREISDIFVEDGEPAFRELEHAAVVRALEEHDGVLALGGGSLTHPGTVERLAGRPVVFLDVGVQAAVKRVGLDAPRPLLLGNPRQRWRQLMEERRPVYTAVARVVVLTDDRAPEDIADEIANELELEEA
ncbi:shikimate kinase [Mangrovactinospora gilvigrisea]|uniref:Shikimate kinase n=1 Tax=Mangrovactinospora gilvigrisea TaxID=1428644 RepID=A0A1J7CHF3_9ACTN|nr:shikimate kinase [Mangrovactinospora gilvigrisea]OIV39066.1 shikimate kinase [Mangrovactinospora gilvigrisea]